MSGLLLSACGWAWLPAPRVFHSRGIERKVVRWTIAPALEDGADAFGIERESTRRVIEEAVDLIEEPRSSERVEKDPSFGAS
jgi:hypothetical protein